MSCSDLKLWLLPAVVPCRDILTVATMADMSAEASAKTLWMGDLAYWMDEAFVYSVFVGAPRGSPVPMPRTHILFVIEV